MPPRYRRLLLRIAASSAATVILALVVGETMLRVRGTFLTYEERDYGEYRPYTGRELDDWIRAWKPGQEQGFVTSEFEHRFVANADGLRDLERVLDDQGRYRIVVVGDSFTEGVGAPFEDSWPRRLERSLVEMGHAAEVINGGVSGSDPFFGYQLLEQRLMAYEPDLVVMSINCSYISDTLLWGGMERFHADGKARSLPLSALEPLYRRSHLARFVVHRVLLRDRRMRARTGKRAAAEHLDAQLAILGVLERCKDLADGAGAQLWVVLHPLSSEIPHRGLAFWKPFMDGLDEKGIAWTDLNASMRATLAGLDEDEYRWPVDRHYNARGYAVLAAAVQEALLARGWLPAPAGSR